MIKISAIMFWQGNSTPNVLHNSVVQNGRYFWGKPLLNISFNGIFNLTL